MEGEQELFEKDDESFTEDDMSSEQVGHIVPQQPQTQEVSDRLVIKFVESPGCGHCKPALKLVESIVKDFKDKVAVKRISVSSPEDFANELGFSVPQLRVPMLIVGDEIMTGIERMGASMRSSIKRVLREEFVGGMGRMTLRDAMYLYMSQVQDLKKRVEGG